MCHWRINILAVTALLALSSCKDGYGYIPGFMDLRPIGMTVFPGESNALLPEDSSPVILCFDTEMVKEETEGILQINSDAGVISGDRSWKGNELYFVPSPPWTAGVRYVLNISGIVHSVDGREIRLERYTPFFAINKSDPPQVERFNPADGGSVGTGGFAIELRFSCPMERFSVESSFTFEGVGNKKFEWADDNRVLKIIPEKALLPWTVYRWTLKKNAKSREGIPLVKEVSAQFCTDLDRLVPQVTQVVPVIFSAGRWLPSGGGIETDLGPGQGIAVEFNKPMGENVLRSLRFEPALGGRTEALSEKSIVFIPNQDPDPEKAYTLIVSADTKDTGGIRLGADYRVTFVPDIPFLRILSFRPDNAPSGAGSANQFDNRAVLKVSLNAPDQGIFIFNIRFSLPFTIDAKKNAALKISLSPYFPGSLEPIALRSVTWLSDDLIRMEWEGLRTGTAGEDHYYELRIPGGRGGVGSGGMYFKEDQILYLEAVP